MAAVMIDDYRGGDAAYDFALATCIDTPIHNLPTSLSRNLD